MKQVKILYGVSYMIYLVFLLDALLLTPVFNLNKYTSLLFPIIWLIIIFFIKKKIIINLQNPVLVSFLILYSYYIVFGILSLDSPMADAVFNEVYACLKFLTTIAVNVYLIVCLNALGDFLCISFITCSCFCLTRYVLYGMPLTAFSNISGILSTNGRYRESFGVFNVNSTGNLAAVTIIMSFLLLAYIKDNTMKKRKLWIVLITVLDVFTFIVLLSSGSRNSILQIILFILVYFYLNITELRQISGCSKNALRTFILIVVGVMICFNLKEEIWDLFVSSLRFKSFVIDIPIFIESKRILRGLGIFNVGLFAKGQNAYGNTVNVDNYYLYVLLETGIMGIILILFVLANIGIKLLKVKNRTQSSFTKFMLSAFVTLLIPSSMMLLTLFFSTIKIYYNS